MKFHSAFWPPLVSGGGGDELTPRRISIRAADADAALNTNRPRRTP